MSKLLYVTSWVDPAAVGGREQLSRLLRDALNDIFGVRMEVIELEKQPGGSSLSLHQRIAGHIDGVTPDKIAEVVERIQRGRIEQAFFNGSNLGLLAMRVRKACPKTRVATFFHNCETRFFFGALRQKPSIRALGVLVANALAERHAVLASDRRICLSKRDCHMLKKYFGRAGTHVLPMALHDFLPVEAVEPGPRSLEKYALFVGGSFYANRQGIEWFVENVAATSPVKTYVVGKGLQSMKAQLERNGNVVVVGSVESLVPWYAGAHFVIAPIFDGSGMKTKVAEALMFGKRIIGTAEAFVGYEDVLPQAGVICKDSAQFVLAIHDECSRASNPIDAGLRALYNSNYSFPAARARLGQILSESDNS